MSDLPPPARARVRSLTRAGWLALFSLSVLVPGAARAALVLGLEIAPGVSRPGEQLAVEITVSNTDATPRTGVLLDLPVPVGVADFNRVLLSGSFTSGSCTQLGGTGVCTAGETITWSLGTLDAHQSTTVTLPPIVGALADGATISFAPIADDSISIPISVIGTTTVDSTRRLELTIDERFQPVASNGDLVYALHYGNSSAVDAAPSALLSLPLPAGTSFVAASDGGVLVGSTIEWALGTLAPGESGTREATLQVGSLAAGTLLAAEASLADTTDAVLANTITEVDSNEDLALGLELVPDPARPGEQLAVELTVTNRDVVAHTGVSLDLRLPQGIDPFNRVLADGPYVSGSCTELGDTGICSPGEEIVWSLGTLDAGQSSTVSIPPIVSAIADGSLVQLRAVAHGSGSDDRVAASSTFAVDATRRLELAIDERFQPVASSAELAYLLHYGNSSTVDSAPDAVLSLPLPAGTSFVGASDGGALVGSTIEWALGTLAPGESGVHEATLLVASLADGSLLAAEPRLADTTDLVRATTITEIDSNEDLVVALEVAPDPARPGEQLAVTATVTNHDVVAHTGLSLLLRLPTGIDPFNRVLADGPFTSGSCTELGGTGVCSPGEQYLWSFGTLDPGQSTSVSIPPIVSAIADGSLVQIRAMALGSGSDDRAASSRTLAVADGRRLELVLAEDRDPVAPGATLEYTLTFGNPSSSQDVTNALLQFTPAAGTSFVSASNGGALVGSRVEWSLGTVAARDHGQRTVSVLVDGGAAKADLLAAQASLSSDDGPGISLEAVTEVDDQEALSLELEQIGTPLEFLQATVTNVDSVAHTGVSLVVRVPDGLQDFLRGDVSGPFTSGSCTELGATGLCSSGEQLLFSFGTLDPSESATVSLPPTFGRLPNGVIVDVHAIAIGTGTDDRATRTLPEPGLGAMLIWGSGLLTLAACRRRARSACSPDTRSASG
ncbi:MAG: DUF11 domain-containing protein [Spirochaetaceae bacterium]|nr:DUF11 domain-containing protein [Myxococcales bacterium]MCB9725670.1 DUF11 domain-containing protein [Spirochaetaceae bacterium]